MHVTRMNHYYLPLHIFCREFLLCARLRLSSIDMAEDMAEELKRIVGQIHSAAFYSKVKVPNERIFHDVYEGHNSPFGGHVLQENPGLTDSELGKISIRDKLIVDSSSTEALCFSFSLKCIRREQMTGQPTNVSDPAPDDDTCIDTARERGLIDVIRILYERRVKLAFYFMVIFVAGALVVLIMVLNSPKSVEGSLGLSFRGIEKSEYPSGKRFNVEDFRSPDLLVKALADAGIPADRVLLQELAAHIAITPVIPAEIRSRWLKQDKDGTKKDEYYPSEFKIGITLGELTAPERLRLYDAVVNRYRERVKYDQDSALSFVSAWDASYDKLANSYDLWDIPELFRESRRSMNEKLTTVITESLQYQDAKYQLAFREVARDLDTWDRTRLQALEALTYQGQLVQNRDIVMQRIQYRIQDLDIQIKQETQEANNATRLLEVINRPNALLAGQLNNKDGIPMVDASALDKLIKSDYVGPVVQRVSNLQYSIRTLESEKARLEKQLFWLLKSPMAGQLPPGHKELIESVSSELNSIIKKYNQLLDEYLTATITSLVIVKQPPLLVSRYSYLMILVGLFFVSLLLALIGVGGERLLEKVREEPQSH